MCSSTTRTCNRLRSRRWTRSSSRSMCLLVPIRPRSTSMSSRLCSVLVPMASTSKSQATARMPWIFILPTSSASSRLKTNHPFSTSSQKIQALIRSLRTSRPTRFTLAVPRAFTTFQSSKRQTLRASPSVCLRLWQT